MKKIDDKENSRAKEVNVATEFDEFRDVLFNEKIIRHKMKSIQSKKHKLRTYGGKDVLRLGKFWGQQRPKGAKLAQLTIQF